MTSQHLKDVGLKATTPRLRILQLLEGHQQRHFSAEEIYKSLLELGEDIGLATVYRVLAQFEAAGLVVRHHFESGLAVFELDQGCHHDHLVCAKCGKVEEFIDTAIENRQAAIAQERGWAITDHCLYIYGVCQKCQKSN